MHYLVIATFVGSVMHLIVPAMYAVSDYCDGIANVRVDRTDPANRIITGDVEILSGDGRFEGVTGNSVVNSVGPCWYAEGTLNIPENKNNKCPAWWLIGKPRCHDKVSRIRLTINTCIKESALRNRF